MKNKVWSVALSLVVSIALWMYVVNYVSPESKNTYYNIPVVFEGESALNERGLMITSGDMAYVTLEISGNRSDLNKINENNITVKVDLSKVTETGYVELDYASISYPGDVQPTAFSVEKKSPERVAITVEKKVQKPVEVRVVYNGSVPEGYLTDTENAVLDYSTINVTGPSSVVELIDHARIDVDLTEQTESISETYRYTLCDAEGNGVDVAQVTVDVAEVRLDLKIQRYKEVTLKADVLYGGGADEKTAVVTIGPETIKVSGSDALLEGLDNIVLGTIDLSTIETSTQMTFPITLPEGVTNLSGVTEATVDITFSGLVTKEFEVTQIHGINVPEGMEYELLSEVLKVKLRGPASLMSKIDADDIIVTVDFTGKEAGSFTIKPVISVRGDEYAAVGAVGSHSVSVTLRAAEEQ